MRIWDPSHALVDCYKLRSTLEDAIQLFETGGAQLFRPKVGVPIQIPKCYKARGCIDGLKRFGSAPSVWAETKYDGERMQIHVTVTGEGKSHITIFSKSKRDSTMDRASTHWIIREAIGLSNKPMEGLSTPNIPRESEFMTSVILEGEMVAFEKDAGIDEFWRIRELVESTAHGVRSNVYRTSRSNVNVPRCPSRPDANRHLAIVFFDILFLNGNSLLSLEYSLRRSVLENVVRPIPQYAFIAHREEIDLSSANSFESGLEKLRQIFAKCIANHEEGLVLKASNGLYTDQRNVWVKLKKDYIPGYGDTIDLAIIGATWKKDRGRTLRVPVTTYTTFHVGIFSNNERVTNTKPHFEVYFTVAYGLDRKKLEDINALIRSMDPLEFSDHALLPYTLRLSSDLDPPSVVLQTPLLAEVFGAGFTKSDGTKFYELRHPRISKVYRTEDRGWHEALTVSDLGRIALKSVGKDRPQRDVDDWCDSLWGKPSSPIASSRGIVLRFLVSTRCQGKWR
ncbi:hypothetical protein M0805_006881 [Coniferiporia weirii]|nr:hypothetical protein M0805_006881 [Coniferiporia weirii]